MGARVGWDSPSERRGSVLGRKCVWGFRLGQRVLPLNRACPFFSVWTSSLHPRASTSIPCPHALSLVLSRRASNSSPQALMPYLRPCCATKLLVNHPQA